MGSFVSSDLVGEKYRYLEVLSSAAIKSEDIMKCYVYSHSVLLGLAISSSQYIR
jgi:hypothetical protein